MNSIYSQIIEAKCHNMNLKEKAFGSANVLKCRVGTTGLCGGDTGHGGRTYFSLTDESNTDMRVMVDGYETLHPHRIEIAFGGDSELVTFRDALMFAHGQLSSTLNGCNENEIFNSDKTIHSGK